jgi:hypothetical protein
MELTVKIPLWSTKVFSMRKDCDGEVEDLFAHHFEHPNLFAEAIASQMRMYTGLVARSWIRWQEERSQGGDGSPILTETKGLLESDHFLIHVAHVQL